MLREHRISTEHFAYARLRISEDALREIVPRATSYADVMRSLGLAVDDTNHRRVRRTAARFGLDTSHFKRRSWGKAPEAAPPPIAHRVLVVLPEHSARTNRAQLHRALSEIGMPYSCASCGNCGEWLGRTITLQIDHINGDWHDNRRENLRYLCPNCHALTETWCRRKEPGHLAG
jgi:5-methylcytosine-specific restriction endonuclease McrA